MPELPEVENIAAGLRGEIVGGRIVRVRLWQAGMVRGPYVGCWRRGVRALEGSRIEAVGRRGKRLIVATDGAVGLVVQLGMTGSLELGAGGKRRAKHMHFAVGLEDGREVRFVDARRFGRLWFLPGLEVSRPDAAMEAGGMTRLGPEADEMGAAEFGRILEADRAVKGVLLDQGRIAGLGNIYVDESLFRAQVHPSRLARGVTGEEARRLRGAIRRVLREAIRHGGTTFSDFRNAYGERGHFLERLRVYGRAGQACKRCGRAIEVVRIAGRSSHYCPGCQAEEAEQEG